jgi:ABC-type ATPase involved in cell division
MVHLDHVNCTLGGSQALVDVSLHVARGEFVFLTGPSGAGKTTLLRVLYGDLKPTSGAATVAGVDLMRLKASGLPGLRRKVAVVFQDFKVLPERSVFDNIALALEVRGVPKASIDRRVRAVIRALDLEERSYAPCRELSGGEQQRVAIARSMVVTRADFGRRAHRQPRRRPARHLIELFQAVQHYGTTSSWPPTTVKVLAWRRRPGRRTSSAAQSLPEARSGADRRFAHPAARGAHEHRQADAARRGRHGPPPAAAAVTLGTVCRLALLAGAGLLILHTVQTEVLKAQGQARFQVYWSASSNMTEVEAQWTDLRGAAGLAELSTFTPRAAMAELMRGLSEAIPAPPKVTMDTAAQNATEAARPRQRHQQHSKAPQLRRTPPQAPCPRPIRPWTTYPAGGAGHPAAHCSGESSTSHTARPGAQAGPLYARLRNLPGVEKVTYNATHLNLPRLIALVQQAAWPGSSIFALVLGLWWQHAQAHDDGPPRRGGDSPWWVPSPGTSAPRSSPTGWCRALWAACSPLSA